MELAVIGQEDFILGFQLAGIRKIYKAGDKPMQLIKEIMQNKEIGVVIIDDTTISRLEEHELLDVEGSISPVFVQLSTKTSQDSLKKLIRKSIGVDLLN